MSFNTKMILIQDGRSPFKMKCQKELCGAEIPAGVKFCTECGTEVQMTAPDIKTTLCPSCKNIVTEGFKYCCSCGGRIDPALFVDIVCSGTTDNGEKCNTVLTSGTSFCPSCGISHKSNISNNLAGDASLKLGLHITHQKGHTFDETKPLVKKERDSSEYSRSDFWEALTIKQELHDDKTEPEPHDDNNEQEPHDDKTEQVLEPNDDKTESVKDNVEDQNHKENKENKSNNMEQEDTVILISDDKENTERNYNKMEQEDTVILISDSDSAEDGDPNNNEMTAKTSKRKTEEKGGLIKKIKTEKDQNDDIAKSHGIEVDQYDIQESGTGEDPPLENT
ncbi:myb-like protein X isoform X1 [Mytilus trossulus]|uniref:myb-like protein X isoform X1 n=2 Tax=Mytilus trossulus TaxID=6551 RepID=UPI003003B33D